MNEQEASGKSVRMFCWEKDICEFWFYSWASAAPHRTARHIRSGGYDRVGSAHHDRAGTDERRSAPHSRRCGKAAYGAKRFAGAGVIHLPASVRVYLCTTPCDMRRSFDGLHGMGPKPR
jgi:hypothetical protein